MLTIVFNKMVEINYFHSDLLTSDDSWNFLDCIWWRFFCRFIFYQIILDSPCDLYLDHGPFDSYRNHRSI